MGVTIHAEKQEGAAPEPVLSTVPLTDEERGRIERLGKMAEQIVEAEAKVAKLKAVRELAELKTEAAALTAQVQATMAAGLDKMKGRKEAGGIFDAEIGKKKKKSELVENAVEMVFGFLGEDAKKIMHLQIGDLKDYLTKPQREQIINETHEGSRSFKITRRA